MEENKIKIEFAHIDEFGQESRVIKTFTEAVLMDTTPLEFLLEEFKSFLLASGFSNTNVEKIQYIED